MGFSEKSLFDTLQKIEIEESGCLEGLHEWEHEGGRSCPIGHYGCSQPVYKCCICGEYDYGYFGGRPGFDTCVRICGDKFMNIMGGIV